MAGPGPAVATGEWRIAVRANPKLGLLALQPWRSGEEGPLFELTMSRLIRQMGFSREQLLGFLSDSVSASPAGPYGDFHQIRFAALPVDLSGQTVLDLGGFDGLMAHECLARGAASATVVDNGEWRHYGWTEPARYPGVTYADADIMDWQTPADFVVCYNVIYHMSDPLGAIRHLRRLTRQQLALCTSVVWHEAPVWQLIDPSDPGGQVVDGHFTVFFKPSPSGLLRALRQNEFETIEEIGKAGDHFVVRCS